MIDSRVDSPDERYERDAENQEERMKGLESAAVIYINMFMHHSERIEAR